MPHRDPLPPPRRPAEGDDYNGFQFTEARAVPTEGSRRRNRATVAVLLGLMAGMSALVVASVPLYRMFCSLTGVGGTPRAAAAAPAVSSERMVTVRFDTSTAKDLPWRFKPVQSEMKVHLGENALAFFRATNVSDQTITGTATFNVTPDKVGSYFNKIACFCFNEQRLGPGETAEMPVSFFVDPAMIENETTNEVQTITLSYTFFRAKGAKLGSVEAAATTN